MPFLDLKNISKNFRNEAILSNVCLSIEQGKIHSLLGTSGSGKTTLLKIIAGLEKQDSGTISLENNDISTTNPQDRNCVYLYQEPLLFPHLNVFENIAFGLRIRKENQDVIQKKVTNFLELIDLKNHSKKSTEQLSGGQRQRISFARALIIEPKMLLLDEPFGALDSITRKQMQDLFLELTKKTKITSLFVTHDLKEVVVMGDSIGKIEKGKLFQYEHKEHFFQDKNSGFQTEVNFWKQFNF